jgi:GAF domain-containing protein
MTVAASDPKIDEADHWQYELREGPCYAAVTTEGPFVSEDVGSDPRWPRYGDHAQRLGLRAQAAFPLYWHAGTHAALNLYSKATDAFADPDQLIGLFARQAARALGHANETDDLHKAIASREVIGQAMGIVMERYGIDHDRAFEYLTRVSQTSNTKLRTVAEAITQLVNQCPADPGNKD